MKGECRVNGPFSNKKDGKTNSAVCFNCIMDVEKEAVELESQGA